MLPKLSMSSRKLSQTRGGYGDMTFNIRSFPRCDPEIEKGHWGKTGKI